MSEGFALFLVSSLGVILVGLFFNFFMKKYNEKQDEIAQNKLEKNRDDRESSAIDAGNN